MGIIKKLNKRFIMNKKDRKRLRDKFKKLINKPREYFQKHPKNFERMMAGLTAAAMIGIAVKHHNKVDAKRKRIRTDPEYAQSLINKERGLVKFDENLVGYKKKTPLVDLERLSKSEAELESARKEEYRKKSRERPINPLDKMSATEFVEKVDEASWKTLPGFKRKKVGNNPLALVDAERRRKDIPTPTDKAIMKHKRQERKEEESYLLKMEKRNKPRMSRSEYDRKVKQANRDLDAAEKAKREQDRRTAKHKYGLY